MDISGAACLTLDDVSNARLRGFATALALDEDCEEGVKERSSIRNCNNVAEASRT